MRIGVYDRYWRTAGGGEKYVGWIAETLSNDHDVDVLTLDPLDEIHERLGLDLSRTRARTVTDGAVTSASADYDVFVNGSFASTIPSAARVGVYVCHFPVPFGATGPAWRRLAGKARARVRGRGDPGPDLSFLETYDRVVANSAYTRGAVRRFWGRDAEVVHPGVAPLAAAPKEPIVLSVGRFFDASRGHSKKQVEMVRAFRRFSERVPGWTYHLVGGCSPEDRHYLDRVREEAEGLPVVVHVDASGGELRDLYARARIFWHAAGLGEDPRTSPDRLEHFGIACVEAMSSGCVPVVYAAGGPAEIVEGGHSGLRFRDADLLADLSIELATDGELWERMSRAAVRRAADFSPAASEAALGRVFGQVASGVVPTG